MKNLLLAFLLNAVVWSHVSAQSTGPVAHWKLDESSGTVAADNSGNNQNGSLNGGAWRPTGGKINGALLLNGTSDFVNTNTTIGSSQVISVAFWLNASSVKYQIPVDKLPASGTAGWSVKLRNNGEIWIRIGSEANHSDLVLANAYQANAWVHVAFTFQNGNLAAYINGAIAGTKINIPQTVTNTTSPLRFGVSASNGNEAFGGLLDDIRVYNRVLSYEEIMQMNGITPPVLPQVGDLTMWYNTESGSEFTNALPIGNGRMGGMIYGNIAQERIGLNEGTVWSGSPGANNKNGAANSLAEARNRVFSGNYTGADALVNSNMISSGNQVYQPVGNLTLNFPGHTPTNYYRELDLKTAIAKVTYLYNGVNYTREYFASYPDQAIIIRLTADQPGKITYTAGMNTPHTPASVAVAGNDVLLLNGEADAIRFQSRAKIKNDGGTISSNGSGITVTGANSSTIAIVIGTNFNSYNNVSGDQVARAAQYLTNVDLKPYTQLRQDHITSYQQLFNRVNFNPGPANTAFSGYPTNQRIATFNISNDPALVKLYYQFGRYLLISCSQPGAQAANLQGVWNDQMSPPWGSNYTTNINTEMNYWLAESANLPECATPLIEKVKSMVPQGRLTAQAHWGVNNGWVSHHQTDLWNHTAPVDGPWGLWPTGGAWLSKHLWEHYLFNQDVTYLADVYPTIKASAQFFLSSMVTETLSGNGYLVTCPSASPENTFNGGATLSFAPTMDIQIIRDIFNSTVQASEKLNLDTALRSQIKAAIAKLPPNKIGQYGQLQEWFNDWDNPTDNHRHVSHLYGAFPGNQITKRGTPALSDAVKTTLTQRGDLSTGWSLAWKINLWARQEDGNHCYDLIRLLLTPERTYNNLFDAHPPFQIDGNFGAVSGIDEMLMQSQNGEIQLMPALPAVWATGSISGLRARGGFVVDSLVWANNRLVKAGITSTVGGVCNVRYGDIVRQINTVPGTRYTLDGSLNVTGQEKGTSQTAYPAGTLVSAGAKNTVATSKPEEGNIVSYWPTLVERNFNIRTDGSYNAVEVVDLNGRIQYRNTVIKGTTSLVLDLGHLTGGFYFVRLLSADNPKTIRIVKMQ
ncbi:glycoside hydrolase N-terminal domain-containing protein [Chitinophaga sp. S165]|uniref:glycosyl hydrolase family 95 catalytic domain-containing protein n=1 Tax=Chitinophaga sp. S165 TaxID=2135462 RepID=UPI000D71B053|nr:glycoside hydrolase N-terminal domain-containing protein [Chitinophaga sp. S165]PWV45843.1 alpha-L-fucosidase 2 [Chitinophaga sp. S165]